MDKDMTSEEKLLHLIRKKDKEKADQIRGQRKEPTVQESSGDIAHKNVNAKNEEKKEIDFLSLGSYFLLLCIFCIVIYLLITLFYYNREDFTLKQANSKETAAKLPLVKLKQETKPFDFYKQEIDKRDVFLLPWESQSEDQSGVKASAEEFSKNLKIVGMVLDNNPKIVIEDLQNKQTYFVGIGEEINGAVLEDVQEGKAVFLYNNEKIELTP